MTRNLAKRVEQLETRMMPEAEPRKMVIQFVDSNGEIVGTKDLELGGRPPRGNQFWRRGGRR